MAEMHDAAFRMGAAGEHDWAELEKAARKMIESSLELADSVEAARISVYSGYRTQGPAPTPTFSTLPSAGKRIPL